MNGESSQHQHHKTAFGWGCWYPWIKDEYTRAGRILQFSQNCKVISDQIKNESNKTEVPHLTRFEMKQISTKTKRKKGLNW